MIVASAIMLVTPEFTFLGLCNDLLRPDIS